MDATRLSPPLVLRGVAFDPPLFCAPMAGLTHSAFRRLLADFGGYGALFTEMLSAKMILHEGPETSPWIKRRPHEGRVIYQLLVSDPAGLPAALARLARLEPAGVDLNAACSAYNVCRQRGGADLFEDLPRLGAILDAMRRGVAGPLTVKLRLGRDRPDWRERLAERLRLFENAGVDALILHPRFEEDKFRRAARHALYAEVAAAARLPIVANGDIAGAEFVRERVAQFAPAAGLMVGRMAAVCPWIFARWHRPDLPVDYADVWRRLCAYIAEDFPPRQAMMRVKIAAPYFARNFVFGHTFASAVQGAGDWEAAREAGSAFLAAAPELTRHIHVAGI